MAKRGRPPISETDVKAAQELYLSLIRLGMTEKKINLVEGMPSWDTRWNWQDDADFSARRIDAQKQGATMGLVEHEERLEQVYQMGLDEAANPGLVSVLKEMGAHARWKASKLHSEVYGDKLKSEVSGPNGAPVPVEVKVTFGK